MNTDNRLIGVMIVVMSLFFMSFAYGSESNIETTAETISSKRSGIDAERSKKDSDGKPDESGGILPMGTLHMVIMEDRTAVLSKIDKQRNATLAYLTKERLAVTGELEKELNRVTDLFQSERQATMVEMEAIGNRIVENAILKSERLIDHFFIRAIQMALVIILACCIVGFLIFRIVAKKKSDTL